MNGKWLLWPLMAAGFQTGCWTAYQSKEARHWPVFPADPDGVCPEVATGVYADSVPYRGMKMGLSVRYFGTVERKDRSLKGVVAPESWPEYVVSVERVGPREIKMGGLEHLRKIGTIHFVKGFKAREIRNEGNHVVETLCDKGVYYEKNGGMRNVPRGMDSGYIEFVYIVSKEANEEIVIKRYMKIDGKHFGILPGLNTREANTYRPIRISDKPLDFESLRESSGAP